MRCCHGSFMDAKNLYFFFSDTVLAKFTLSINLLEPLPPGGMMPLQAPIWPRVHTYTQHQYNALTLLLNILSEFGEFFLAFKKRSKRLHCIDVQQVSNLVKSWMMGSGGPTS